MKKHNCPCYGTVPRYDDDEPFFFCPLPIKLTCPTPGTATPTTVCLCIRPVFGSLSLFLEVCSVSEFACIKIQRSFRCQTHSVLLFTVWTASSCQCKGGRRLWFSTKAKKKKTLPKPCTAGKQLYTVNVWAIPLLKWCPQQNKRQGQQTKGLFPPITSFVQFCVYNSCTFSCC